MKDHEHSGFSWYLSNKPGIFNPYNVSDRISRKTWYDNVTFPDIRRKGFTTMSEYKPSMNDGSHDLFYRLSKPKSAPLPRPKGTYPQNGNNRHG